MGTPFNKIGGNPIVLGLDGLKDEVKAGLNTPDEFPALAAGSSRAMLGDAETASWTERTTAADGAALIESVKGNTLRWNQLNENGNFASAAGYSATNATVAVADNMLTLTGNSASVAPFFAKSASIVAGHKLLFTIQARPQQTLEAIAVIVENATTIRKASVPSGTWSVVTGIVEPSSGGSFINVYANAGTGMNEGAVTEFRNMQLFDLTAMFGAGNEPATVAEFEALFPEPYYPYDPGSLLPVRMEGIETVAADESWTSECTIPASTYFPQGMRSAGTVRDELRADAAITRVGAVDLGSLTWTYDSGATHPRFVAVITGHAYPATSAVANATCAAYDTISQNDGYGGAKSKGFCINNTGIWLWDPSYTNAATFKTAMSGVMLHYALATPTVTPIDPPLPLSYRTGAGGTERVMVASGTTSAPPVFVTRYPLDPADLAASIAPVDGPIAKTNHQVGDLLMLGFTLCKATQVIVTGETIEIGTNVTRTTVAAELAALSE